MSSLKKTVKRKKAAKKIIRRRMLYAAGLGLIPIPIVDAAGILGVQVLMLRDVARLYGVSFKEQRVKSFIGSLVGSLGAMGVVKAIPGIGSLLGGATVSLTAAAATYAIGKVFVQHFDQGGTLLDFDPEKSRKYFQKEFDKGKRRAQALQAKEEKKVSGKLAKIFGSAKETEERASASLDREARIKLLKAKRSKALKAKKRRKARRKWLGRLSFLLLLALVIWRFFIYEPEAAASSTELDLYMQETAAKKVELQPAGELDSMTIATIAAFSPVSTEGVMAKFIQSPDATYPKRYALSAVRFTGSSSTLSGGASQQLANIAYLMKKYPDLIVNVYGHTTNIGPEFSRQRIGRERARVLTDVFANLGIPSYRITGNYIEKPAGTHDEYWGAEIVIDVATVENVVNVKTPKLPSSVKRRTTPPPRPPTPNLSNAADSSQEEAIDDISEENADSIEGEPPLSINPLRTRRTITKPTEAVENIDSALEDSGAAGQEEELPPRDSLTSRRLQNIESVPATTTKEETTIKTSSTTTEQVMLQYINSAKPTYPKAIVLNDVRFEGESAQMDARGKNQITNIAQVMKQYPNMKVGVYCYASNGGSAEMSEAERQRLVLKWQGIAQRRARAIKKELHDQGIANRRIETGFRLRRKEPTDKYWGAEIVIESM